MKEVSQREHWFKLTPEEKLDDTKRLLSFGQKRVQPWLGELEAEGLDYFNLRFYIKDRFSGNTKVKAIVDVVSKDG